ncbi:MAG TPA: hypothetical protein VG847_07025 [Chitinophagaceae bacterium]|nr:hypothetical protein [Chitinophagaceae bacterium]
MTKNKVVLDLEKINLTDRQLHSLNKSIHKVVAARLKTITAARPKKTYRKAAYTELRMAAAGSMTAQLSVTFTNTIPGDSSLTAIYNGESQTLTQSGTLTFHNVKHGDTILVQDYSLGDTAVNIDISADPTQMNFTPGHHVDQFLIS